MSYENVKEEFEALTKPLIKFLNDRGNPHSVIFIDTNSAELMLGEIVVSTDEFIKD